MGTQAKPQTAMKPITHPRVTVEVQAELLALDAELNQHKRCGENSACGRDLRRRIDKVLDGI